MAKYQPGQSGNPRGRPKKDRALTDLLEKAGSATVEYHGKNISGKRLMAQMVWQGIVAGEVEFPDGKHLRLSPQDWKDFVKWAYSHIDGPPRAEVDVTSAGEPVVFRVEYVTKENDAGVSYPTPDSPPEAA